MADAAAKDKGSELKIRGQADAEKRKSKWDDERKPVRQIFCAADHHSLFAARFHRHTLKKDRVNWQDAKASSRNVRCGTKWFAPGKAAQQFQARAVRNADMSALSLWGKCTLLSSFLLNRRRAQLSCHAVVLSCLLLPMLQLEFHLSQLCLKAGYLCVLLSD